MEKYNIEKINKNLSNGISLILEDNILFLYKEDEKSKVFVDFCSNKALKRINEQGILKQDICKAIGFNKSKDLSILDCTAGFGKDSFIFASITTKTVTMLERNEFSYLLLENGLERLKLTENEKLKNIYNKLKLINIDANNFLKETQEKYDVIYLDPMFESNDYKSKAKVKKEMAFFHQTVGKDDDADKLLELALNKANKRVVVKRHAKAPFLNNTKPDIQFTGKSNRFDVYLKKLTL